jgi:hypothetical protein
LRCESTDVLKLLERTISSLDERLVLLAPNTSIPSFFKQVNTDSERHRELIRDMQKLRGAIYFHDGALGRDQLSPDGLHETTEDERSWHLLMLDQHQRVTGCAWYLQHDSTVRVEDLRVRCCPLARMPEWRDKLWAGVQSELERARRERIRYAEVGGWAVKKESRSMSDGLVLALAGYGLGRIAGGCLGITTATVRHCSSAILRRIGGSSLHADGAEVPSYYDPRYKCEMEILRFDSRHPSAMYAGLIEQVREKMAHVPVIAQLPSHAAFQSTQPFYQQPAASSPAAA